MNDEMLFALMDMYNERMLACSSTSGRRYNYKKMLDLWENYPVIRKVWNFISDCFYIVGRFVKKTAGEIQKAFTHIDTTNVETNFPEGTELVYLIRLLDEKGALVWSKIGTTTRTLQKRMKEHLKYYRKDGVTDIEVTRVYNCGDIPAEGLESELRSKYMKIYPGTFRKNDRFTGVEFNLNEADEIVKNYLTT